MRPGLTFALLLVLAAPALSEGRNDPILGCAFENGRQVVLAEDGDGFEWREADHTGPAQCSFGATGLCTTDHPIWGQQMLIVASGASEQETRLGVAPGSAVLASVVFAPQTVTLAQQSGLCERMGR